MNLTICFSLIGGLGLFLYGMKLMSEGLEKAAGARMRGILEFFTKNRLIGMVVGILFTAVVQSSSATTVMVVSFVNSGLMKLSQAAGVIMGANIGTTVTSQLIAFNLSEVAPLFVMAGVAMIMFSNKINVQKIGEVVLGFGILFMGLSTMSGAMESLKGSPYIVEILSSLTSPFLGVLVGFVITAVLQSSSATVGIVLLMATQGLLDFNICFFLILGCNMGSCVSALLASIGAKKDAKRAAWIHFLFNIIGSAIIFIILMIGLDPIADGIYRMSGGNIGRAVANAHTLIKVVEVVLLFPFIQYIVKATYLIVPGEDASADEEFKLEYIVEGQVMSPSIAVIDAIREMKRMGEMAIENVKTGISAILDPTDEKIAFVKHHEKYINFLNHRITDYLVNANQLQLPVKDQEMMGGLFHVVNDIERIGDHAENFIESALLRKEKKIELTEKEEKQIRELTEMATSLSSYALDMFAEQDQEHMQEIIDLEDEIDAKEKKYQRSYIKRLAKNKCTPESGMIFSDTISGLERVGDHATNIAFAVMESDSIDDFED